MEPADNLIEAATAGKDDDVRDILMRWRQGDRAGDVNAGDIYGNTALSFACKNGHEGCARQLLGAGASTEKATAQGAMPLFNAAAHGHDGCVRLLLAAGADESRRCNGLTPLEVARRLGRRDCVRLLAASTEREPPAATGAPPDESKATRGDHVGNVLKHEALVREARDEYGDLHHRSLTAMSRLAVALAASGDMAQAEPLARAVLIGFRETLGEQHPHAREAQRSMADILERKAGMIYVGDGLSTPGRTPRSDGGTPGRDLTEKYRAAISRKGLDARPGDTSVLLVDASRIRPGPPFTIDGARILVASTFGKSTISLPGGPAGFRGHLNGSHRTAALIHLQRMVGGGSPNNLTDGMRAWLRKTVSSAWCIYEARADESGADSHRDGGAWCAIISFSANEAARLEAVWPKAGRTQLQWVDLEHVKLSSFALGTDRRPVRALVKALETNPNSRQAMQRVQPQLARFVHGVRYAASHVSAAEQKALAEVEAQRKEAEKASMTPEELQKMLNMEMYHKMLLPVPNESIRAMRRRKRAARKLMNM